MGNSPQARCACDLARRTRSPDALVCQGAGHCGGSICPFPIDLIPDFIPLLGYLDDLVILPLGIMLVVCLIPPDLMAKHREAASQASKAPVSRTAAAVFIAEWVLSEALLVCVLR